MGTSPKQDTLRDSVGQVISDILAEGIDIWDSREIDIIADAVVIMVLELAKAAVLESAGGNDEIFVTNVIDALEGLKP